MTLSLQSSKFVSSLLSYSRKPSYLLNSTIPNSIIIPRNQLSSGEAFTALKPFFFAVHPDLFGQFPKERAVNENSLKQLNAYIESATHERPINPTNLIFYVRRATGTNSGTGNTPLSSTTVKKSENEKRISANSEAVQSFEAVKIDLGQTDVRRTVCSILEKCNLPTSYVDSIPKHQSHGSKNNTSRRKYGYEYNTESAYWRESKYKSYEEAEREIARKKQAQDDLETWLGKNVEDARLKLIECLPIREEMIRIKSSLCKTFEIKKIIWDCGWGARHMKGCLDSFSSLITHHPEIKEILKGRIVIFGRESGVSIDGDIVLNSAEVRTNWLDVIKNVAKQDPVILRIPSIQRALSRSLKDIKVVHRKFEPIRLAENYETRLRKLTTSLGDYRGKTEFPSFWPENLSHLELVVETDAGPLMVSPTGQIIVPSSCPPFLLVNFISDNIEEASKKLDLYKGQKYEERALHAKCLEEFGLAGLEKADNVTPNLMISCCAKLLAHTSSLAQYLRGTHLWITTYYSVHSDGEICIPWDWKLGMNTMD